MEQRWKYVDIQWSRKGVSLHYSCALLLNWNYIKIEGKYFYCFANLDAALEKMRRWPAATIYYLVLIFAHEQE